MVHAKGWLKRLLLGFAALFLVVACNSGSTVNTGSGGASSELTVLKFGVGPYFPTPNETADQFEPLFQALAEKIGVEADVTVTEDWVGISEALRSGTLDAAWLGPWGYVLANHNEPDITAIATVEYKEQPFYYSVLMAKADAPFDTLDEAIELSQSGETLSLSLADVGSTSGWLIPTAEFTERGIDPKAVFDYSEGASHAAQAIAVLSDQVDIASDYDRNLDVLESTGRINKADLKIIWQSDPLPNDPIAIRGGLPADIVTKLQEALVSLTAEEAAQGLLPENYTGFVASDGSNYEPIQAAGNLVGKLDEAS